MYFTFITTRSKIQGASDFLLDYRVFISEVKVRITFILSQFQELRTGRLVRASASSMLKGGDWSHMGNMTNMKYVLPVQISEFTEIELILDLDEKIRS